MTRFNLTGGNVDNIALNATFLAAKVGSSVTMPLVLASVRTELDKIERPINEAGFRWQAPIAVGLCAIALILNLKPGELDENPINHSN